MNPEEIMRIADELNTRQKLNAIGRVHQYAILLMDLWKHDEKHPHEFKPYHECENDQAFYAQIVDLRPPRGKGEQLLASLGITQRAILSLYRNLLKMPLDIWHQADDENWSLQRVLATNKKRIRLADAAVSSTPAIVYLMFNPTTKMYKIGMTGHEIRKRLSVIRREHHPHVKVVHTISCETVATAYKVEHRLHKYFHAKRWINEWFRLTARDVEWLFQFSRAEDVPSEFELLRKVSEDLQNKFVRAYQTADEQDKEHLYRLIEQNIEWWTNFKKALETESQVSELR
jgi:hypothetical protein